MADNRTNFVRNNNPQGRRPVGRPQRDGAIADSQHPRNNHIVTGNKQALCFWKEEGWLMDRLFEKWDYILLHLGIL